MKTALVIPTCDAVKRGVWKEVLDAVARQEWQPDERIVVDSGSVDDTVELAVKYGWRVETVRRGEFDHGLTRGAVVDELRRRGFDTVVFLSQDVVLHSPGALKCLVDHLYANPVAGCCGRQIDRREHSFDAWQRNYSYPATSLVKTRADIPRLGLMTPFCSDAFAAWKIEAVAAAGGFPRAAFGEDMLLAAKIIGSGGAIGYCAEAVAVHEHSDSLVAAFRRGRDVGEFHRAHPELLREYGGMKKPHPPVSEWRYMLLPFLAKSLGYVRGRWREGLIPWLLFTLMWLLLLPAIILYDVPQRDVACRYAPMAEAFAAGEWTFAFHPRVPPLLPAAGGVIARLLHCGGYTACQLAGAAMVTCGIFPLYRGCLKIYGAGVAALAALMYVLCSSLFRFGYFGLREAAGVLGIVLLFRAAAGLRECRRSFAGYLWFGVGEAVLLLSRGDLALFVAAGFLALLVFDVAVNFHFLRTLAAALLTALAISPAMIYNYRMIGYPVPDVRHGAVVRSLCRKVPALKFLENPRPRLPLDIAIPREDPDE